VSFVFAEFKEVLEERDSKSARRCVRLSPMKAWTTEMAAEKSTTLSAILLLPSLTSRF